MPLAWRGTIGVSATNRRVTVDNGELVPLRAGLEMPWAIVAAGDAAAGDAAAGDAAAGDAAAKRKRAEGDDDDAGGDDAEKKGKA